MKKASRSRIVTIVDPIDQKIQRLHRIFALVHGIVRERSKGTVLQALEGGLKNAGVEYVVYGTNYRPHKIDDFIDITEIPTEDPRVLLWIYSCSQGPERTQIIAIRHMEISSRTMCSIA